MVVLPGPLSALHVIPGTTSVEHIEEDWGTMEVTLRDEIAECVGDLINQGTVSGPRYPAATQAEIDTEEFQQQPAGV